MKKLSILLSVFILIGFTNSALGLTLSPVKIEVAADPGQTITGQLELLNEEAKSTTYYTSFENFEARGESGAPYFIGAEKGLATWITAQPDVVVNTQERVTVPYSIKVPLDATPGGYFAAILFGTQPPKSENDTSTVSIGSKVGALVLLRVNGDVEEAAGLTGFSTKDNQSLFSSLPITFEYVFNNVGGDRVVPAGDVTIKNTFRATSATLKANEGRGSVLPNSSRKFSVDWESSSTAPADQNGLVRYFTSAWNQVREFHFGWYTAQLDTSWGNSPDNVATASLHIFIIPWQLLTLLVIIIALLMVYRKHSRKKLKRRIMSELKKQS